MFIEFQTKDDKAISYNVNNIVFVGEMKESVSVMFDDNSHVIFTDEYGVIVKRLIGLTKAIVDPSVYVQFETRKEERIAFPIRRVFYILEQETATAIMFNDGTRIEVLQDYSTVMKSINGKVEKAVECPTATEKIKS